MTRPKRGKYADGRVWHRMVNQVVVRDYGQCWLCGHYSAKSADHIWPDTENGPAVAENLNAVHARGSPCPDCSVAAGKAIYCNEIKGMGTAERARRKIEERTGLTLPAPSYAQVERAKFAMQRWGNRTTLNLPEADPGLPGPEGRDFLLAVAVVP